MIRTQEEVDASGKRAREIYHREIKPQLTDDDVNKFVAIDPDSGEWAISETEDMADELLRRKVDVSHPLLLIHPRIWIDSFGGIRPEMKG